ncbi:MAG: class I SAM-dependent methyltransferase, partial [Spirochaetales bacterium]|nr:class I SAM-dependent methyltransferase [Spirochaetales bacterium]
MEFVAMNSFLRRWILKWIEFRLFNRFLRKHNLNLAGSVILDVGCGSGHSTKLIGSQYKPRELVAFDMMPEQIELAKRTYREARFIVGD